MSRNSPFSGINHLALVTGDMDATTRFYRDVLGCKLVATIGTERFRHYFFSIGPCNTIAFFEWHGVQPNVPEKAAGEPASDRQFDHLSFNVATYEELLDLRDRLCTRGIDVTRIVDHQFIHSIYFNDPNGIALEASVWLVDPETDVVYGDADPVPSVQGRPIPGPTAKPRPLSPEVRERAMAAGLAAPD
jgi:catechol 2,3-dioxygenase-like lactoylglutathione lyase family enzyme